MTDKRIIYTLPDGTVSVVVPSDDFLAEFKGTTTEALAAIRERAVPAEATNVTTVLSAVIPNDRTFRNAWTQGSGTVSVDMPQARVIHMNRIREVRNDELKKEDINFQRALESEDASAKATVATKKQTLRDIPQSFDLSGAGTGDELDALWPSELPERTPDGA